jgi:hypothetical protein
MAFRTLFQLLIDALLASAAISAAYAIRPSYFGPDGELYRLHVGAIALFAFVLLFSSFLMMSTTEAVSQENEKYWSVSCWQGLPPVSLFLLSTLLHLTCCRQ